MNKIGIGIALCAIFLIFSGCSVLVATPHVTHIPVKGINNEMGEYIIVTDDPRESDLDIKITDRYAIKLDFQWLWNKQTESNTVTYFDDEDNPYVTAPWVTLKYRF
jgi:hypothetical protein